MSAKHFLSFVGRALLWASLLAALALIGVGQWRAWHRSAKAVQDFDRLAKKLPHLEAEKHYAASHRCQACHPSQYASWHHTYHRTMTQLALPENVVGTFDGTTIASDGLAYRVYREGDEFWAEMPDPDVMMYVVQGGKKLALQDIPRVRARVVMTTGSHHYQTYWVASPRYDRLLQTLPLVYLIKDQRWIPREAAFLIGPHSSERLITQWNHHCIRCHSTAGNPGLNPKTGMLDTRVAELGIACESCHGPGEEHVRRNQDPLRRYGLHLSSKSDPTIVNPAKLDHRKASEVCGQCHGVYIMRDEYAMKSAYEGSLYKPGDDLHKTRYYIQHPGEHSTAERLEDLRKNPDFFRERWWDDGTILAGGREYTAMAVSGCYKRGKISCLSCHSMHSSDPNDQLKVGMDGPAACTQCHHEPQYTTQLERHTFHKRDSTGSNCLNCHMPHTTYALFGAIRSHQIASPNIAASVRQGVPNACNLCHLDKTLAWTQENMAERYGTKKLPLTEEQQNISTALLWLLKGHAAQRAITAWHVGWKPAQEASGADWLAPFQARLLADPYGVVRYVAEHNLNTLPGFEDFRYDFLSPEEELQRQVRKAVGQWKAQAKSLSHVGDQILINRNGEITESKVQTLLRERDNRSVTIKE